MSKVHELSLYMIRMCLQNVDFVKFEHSLLAVSAIQSAMTLIKLSPIHEHLVTQ